MHYICVIYICLFIYKFISRRYRQEKHRKICNDVKVEQWIRNILKDARDQGGVSRKKAREGK